MTVEAWFEPARAFIGEPTFLAIRIENAKPRALPIVRIFVRLPEGLDQVADPEPTAFHGHRRRTQVDGDAEMVLRFPVHPQHRGEFWLDRVDVELSDPFDLAPIGREIAVERPLLVMPSPRGGVPLRMRRWLPFGAPAPTPVCSRTASTSPACATTSRATRCTTCTGASPPTPAHLQTKTYEPTRSAEVLFALDLSDGEPFWEKADAALAEETIGMASYLARQAIHAGWRAGLVANTHLRRGRGPLRVSAAASAGQESILFTALARMPNQPTDDLAPILREVGRRLTRRTTVVVLSPRPGSVTDPRDGASAAPGVRRHPRVSGRGVGGRPGGGLMMRSLTSPAGEGGAHVSAAAVAAAVPAALAAAVGARASPCSPW